MHKSKGHTDECAKWLQSILAKTLKITIDELKSLHCKFLSQNIISDSDKSSDIEQGEILVNDETYTYFYFHNEKGSYIELTST